MKAAKPGRWAGLVGLVKGRAAGGARAVVLALLAAGVLAVTVYFGWQQWGDQLSQSVHYTLSVDKIDVTPLPPWIQADVKAEVVRDGSLANLNVMDPNVTVQVAQAFALHAWVAKVKRVRKHFPVRVVVDLKYRRPIAMVQAESGGFWPVDTDGVLLPPDEFSPQQTRNYLRVLQVNTPPAGPVGTSFGDPRVAGAALLAAALGSNSWALGIDRLVVSASTSGNAHADEPFYELRSRDDGARVLWGRAPGREAPGEAPASEKLARLLHYVEQSGRLDQLETPVDIDVRNSGSISVVPRTARRSTSGSFGS